MLTRHRDRVTADLIRGLVCLPIAVFLYLAETGVFGGGAGWNPQP
jgi:hypothetical protein